MYKKNRGKNFTEDEKKLLLDLVVPYKEIVKNVKTDNIWKLKKDEVWDTILKQYNSNIRQLSGIRNVSQLKTCYATTKRDTKKEKSNKNVEIYKEHYNKTILSSVDEIDANILIDLIMPNKYTIEQNEYSQKNDGIWESIQESYNSQTTTEYKSISDLKYMYKLYIKDAKITKRKHKEEVYKTGGGQSSLPLSSIKEKVMSIFGDKMEPLGNNYDNDTEYRAITVAEENSPIEENSLVEESSHVDEKSYKILTV